MPMSPPASDENGGPSSPQTGAVFFFGPPVADEHRAVEARQAIDPYTDKLKR